MSTLVIEGGRRIEGRVDVEGNKNAALPLIAACLLTDQWCTLHNMPRIADVEVMARLLLDLGADVEGIGTHDAAHSLREHHQGRARQRAGRPPARLGAVDGPAARAPRSRHRGAAGRRLSGAAQHQDASRSRSPPWAPCSCRAPGIVSSCADGLKPASIYLDEASVTGTETALLAAAAAPGTSEIRHAACEPHVVELCEFLRAMGVGITGEGSHTIRVEGLAKPHGAEKTLYGDYIEAGSWAVVGAITGGHIEVGGTRPVDMEVVAAVLTKMGVRCVQDNDVFRVEVKKLVGAGRITTGLWPGFPSDLVSLVTVLATQAEGATLVHDWMYELRLFALEQMSGMGADLFLCDPHRIIVTGPRRLRGKSLDSRDIRSGMALIAAALIADGQSRVEPLETVERGYSRVVERLQKLGGSVSKI